MWGMNRLGPSLVAGVAAAAGLFLIQLGAGMTGSGRGWTAFYWILCTVAFSAAGAGSRWEAGRRFGLAVLGVGAVLAGWLELLSEWNRFSAEGMSLLALGLTFVFGGVRSGLFDATANLNPRKAIAAEGVIGLTALLFSGWLSGPAPWGPALSLWGFALVQSLYTCVPSSFLAKPIRSAQAADPFETAFSKLDSMLGESNS